MRNKCLLLLISYVFCKSICGAQTYIDVITIHSCNYGPTGSIETIIIEEDMQPDWLPPFSLEAINTTTGQAYSTLSEGYQAVFSPVPAGAYSISLYLGNNCELTFDVEVGSIPSIPILAKAVKTNAYCGLDNGTARTTPLSGGNPPYLYQWSNGEITPEIENLPSGYYCVTITDQECGYAVRCVMVEEEELPSLQLVSFHHLSMCEGNGSQEPCTGEIDMELLASAGYTCYWSGPNGFTSTELDLSALCDPGMYQLNIELQPGCQNLTYSLELCCCQDPNPGSPHLCQAGGSNDELTAEGLVFPAFEGNTGSILLDINGGMGSYTWITWVGPNGYEGYGQAIYQLAPGIYNATITDGCQEIHQSYEVSALNCHGGYTDQQLADIFLQQIVPACETAGEGSAVIVIPNIPDYLPELYVNGSGPITLIPDRNIYYYPLTNLSGDAEIDIVITLGNCSFEFTYTIPEIPLTEEFSHIQDLICYYDQYCYGDFIGTIEQPAYIDLPNGDYTGFGIPGSQGGCTVPVLCQGEQVTELHLDLVKVTVAEYIVILDAFLDAGIISEDSYTWLDLLLDRRNLDLCDNVWYCPGDLTIAYEELFEDLSNGSYPWLPTDDPECFIIPCIPPQLVCLYDLDIPDVYDDYFFENPPQPCFGVTQSFLQLRYWHQNGFLHSHPGYSGSELAVFMTQHMNSEPAVCAEVRYCCNTFNFLYSNIDQVSCGVYFPDPLEVTCNYAEDQNGHILYALCCSEEPFCEDYFHPGIYTGPDVNVCEAPNPGIALQQDSSYINGRSLAQQIDSSAFVSSTTITEKYAGACPFDIFPSPVTSHFIIDQTGAMADRVDIYSMDMRRIMTIPLYSESSRILFPEAHSGIYFIIFIDEDDSIICHKTIYHDH